MENMSTGVTDAIQETLLNEPHPQATMQTICSVTQVYLCITGSLPFSKSNAAMTTKDTAAISLLCFGLSYSKCCTHHKAFAHTYLHSKVTSRLYCRCVSGTNWKCHLCISNLFVLSLLPQLVLDSILSCRQTLSAISLQSVLVSLDMCSTDGVQIPPCVMFELLHSHPDSTFSQSISDYNDKMSKCNIIMGKKGTLSIFVAMSGSQQRPWLQSDGQ